MARLARKKNIPYGPGWDADAPAAPAPPRPRRGKHHVRRARRMRRRDCPLVPDLGLARKPTRGTLGAGTGGHQARPAEQSGPPLRGRTAPLRCGRRGRTAPLNAVSRNGGESGGDNGTSGFSAG